MKHLRILLATLAALAVTLGFVAPAQAATASRVTGTVQVALPEIDLTGGPKIIDVPVTVTNTTTAALRSVTVTLRGPVGWSTAPESITLPGNIRPGESKTATFQVLVPSPPRGFNVRTFSATVRYVSQAGWNTVAESVNVTQGEPLANLAAARNNVGTTTVATIPAGNFDGERNSFGAPQLAAVGLTPGAKVTSNGATFTWPPVAPGSGPDNVAASGQAIALSGSGSRLAFLGSGSSMGAAGNVTVHYTDGTTSTGSFGFPNWSFDTLRYGSTLVAAMDGRHTPSGPANQQYKYSVFSSSIAIDKGKQVRFVVLPANASLHIFDMVLVP